MYAGESVSVRPIAGRYTALTWNHVEWLESVALHRSITPSNESFLRLSLTNSIPTSRLPERAPSGPTRVLRSSSTAPSTPPHPYTDQEFFRPRYQLPKRPLASRSCPKFQF